ncbi:MAG: hypothetical protein LBF34_01415 [Puniceicoccales bacterium]|jgi:hypothetical protein|nr:hypothetical protein [Puniceicoccales bacterium]
MDIIVNNLLKSHFFLDMFPMVCESKDVEEIMFKNRDNKKILKSIGLGAFLIGKFPGIITSVYAAAPYSPRRPVIDATILLPQGMPIEVMSPEQATQKLYAEFMFFGDRSLSLEKEILYLKRIQKNSVS